jgi:DNA excision repair protein ERCC-3
VNLRLTNLMMDRQTENPLIIQSDSTILMDMHAPRATEARERMAPFTELVKSPEHVHTYRLTPLSIWNACAVGMSGEKMIAVLRDFAKYPPPEIIFSDIHDLAERYGSVILKRQGDHLKLLLRGCLKIA